MLRNVFKLTTVVMLFSLGVLASPAKPSPTRSPNNTVTAPKPANTEGLPLWTFYDVATGSEVSCGGKHVNSDAAAKIVALSFIKMGLKSPSPLCNKRVLLTYNGKQREATVLDTCMGCEENQIDLARDLFEEMVGPSYQDKGTVHGDWHFI